MDLVILDRDGVINYDSPNFVRSPAEWEAIPGSLEAIARLNRAGYLVAIATNQSGVGRGYFTLQTLFKIHEKMKKELAALGAHLDAICYCPHHPDADCECRKPKPGMLIQIALQLKIDLRNSIVIGDSQRDLDAAAAVGARAFFIDPKVTLSEGYINSFPNLAFAVDRLFSQRGSK